MCQALGTCYDETRESSLRTAVEDARISLLNHPIVSREEVVRLVKAGCSRNSVELSDFIDYAREDFVKSRKLAVDMQESEAVRNLQEAYCKFYEKVLSAFGCQT